MGQGVKNYFHSQNLTFSGVSEGMVQGRPRPCKFRKLALFYHAKKIPHKITFSIAFTNLKKGGYIHPTPLPIRDRVKNTVSEVSLLESTEKNSKNYRPSIKQLQCLTCNFFSLGTDKKHFNDQFFLRVICILRTKKTFQTL